MGFDRERYEQIRKEHAGREQELMAGGSRMYGIYQIKEDAEDRHSIAFLGFERLKKMGRTVDPDNYELVYAAQMPERAGEIHFFLEDLYEKFNMVRPDDFVGHSLSVSDIIWIHGERNEAFYVDSFGFRSISEFAAEMEKCVQERNGQDQEKEAPEKPEEDGKDKGQLVFEKQEGSGQNLEQKPASKLPGTDDREQDSFGDMESFRKKTEELFHLIDGMTAGALEEQVLDHVNGVLADYGEEAEAEACAVTGSRCRGLEQDGSDVDVVVEVRGEGVREETLLEMLRSDWVTVGGVRVDIHPIVPDQTGTLAEYLKGEEERIADRHPDYKPLAKVEELEEQNYNMIDNQLNNTKPKEKDGLSGLRYSNFQIEKRVEDDGYRLIADVRFEGSGTVRPEQVVGEFKNREEITAYCERNHLEYVDITNYLQNRIAKKQQKAKDKDSPGRQGHEREIGGGAT